MKKKLISMLLAVLMVVSLFSGLTMNAYADDVDESLYFVYVMTNGDTVLKVCQANGINYYTCKAAIMKMNGFTSDTDFRFIPVGRDILFPVSNAAAAKIAAVGISAGTTGSTGTSSAPIAAATSDTIAYYLIPHTMARGETVYTVCQALGVNYGNYSDQILKLNNLASLSNVKAGSTYVFPVGSKPAVGTSCYQVVAHKVISGETAYTICNGYGVSYNGNHKLLQALNGTNNLNLIKAGSTFYVPVQTVISAAPAASTTTTTPAGATTSTTSGTGTSSAPAAKTYALKANVSSGGAVSFYVNNKAVSAAAAGDVVTVVTTANNKFALDSFEVVYADGSASPKVSGSDFVMPAAEICVNAKFVKGYDVTLDCAYTNGLKALVNGLAGSSAVQGAPVQIVSNNPALSIDGKVELFKTENGKFWKSIDPTMTFDMPAFDVTAKADMKTVTTFSFFKSVVDKIAAKPEDMTEKPETGSFVLQANGSTISKAAEGTKVTILASPAVGYKISGVAVYMVNEKGELAGEVTVTNYDTFTMPAGNAKVYVSFAPQSAKITIEPSSIGKAEAFDASGNKISYAKTGDKVTIKETVDASVADAYEAAKPTVYRVYDNTLVEVSGDASSGYTFIMPGEGARVVPCFEGKEPVDLKVTKIYASGAENADNTILINKDPVVGSSKYKPGTMLNFSEHLAEGYKFVKYEVYVNGVYNVDLTKALNESQIMKMPDLKAPAAPADPTDPAPVEVKAYFEASSVPVKGDFNSKYWLMWVDAENYNKGKSSYEVGKESVFLMTPAPGYKINDIKKVVVTVKGTGEPVGTWTADGGVNAAPQYGFNILSHDITTVENLFNETAKAYNVYEGQTINVVKGFIFNMPAAGVDISVTVEKSAVTMTLDDGFTATNALNETDTYDTKTTDKDINDMIKVSNSSSFDQTLSKDFKRALNRDENVKISMVNGNKFDLVLKELWYKDDDGVEHYLEASNGVVTFKMPDSNIKLTKATVIKTIVKTSDIKRALSHVSIKFYTEKNLINETSSYRVGDTVYFRIFVDKGYVLEDKDALTVINTKDGKPVASLKTSPLEGKEKDNYYYSFVLEDANAFSSKIRCEAVKPDPIKFNVTHGLDKDRCSVQVVTESQTWNYEDDFKGYMAKQNATVTVKLVDTTLDGSYLKGAIGDDTVKVTGVDSVKVTRSGNSFSFKMPGCEDGDLTIAIG